MAGTLDRFKATPRFVALGAVAIYRAAVSPLLHAMNGPACRFEPSCSAYAQDAIAEYGIIRGGVMAIWRLARCNPMGGHGYDPVRAASSEADAYLAETSAGIAPSSAPSASAQTQETRN
ncbi:MAG: membrane protein insertion efficiency factor YidD [Candidatus Binatus sp.]